LWGSHWPRGGCPGREVNCPSCDGEVQAGARFCPTCGVPLPRACPGCGKTVSPAARFCEACGTAIAPSREPVPAPPPAPPPDVPSVPESFGAGRYQMRRFLGEGGRKRVYQAFDTALHREVAIATIKTEGLDEAALERVRREAQAMARLGDHPHVVTIHDIGDEDGRPFIVSQYMSGGSVDALLDRAENRRLPVPEA